MFFLLTKTTVVIYCTGILAISALSYTRSDRVFSSTKIPSPSCSSLLNLKAISTPILINSLTETINCLDQTQYPETNKVYQEILQFKEIILSSQDSIILDSVQSQMRSLKYNLEKEETFIKYQVLAFMVWYLPLILWYLVIILIFSVMFDFAFAAHRGDL